MTALQNQLYIAMFEPSKISEIITAWCFFVVIVIVELTLPIMFGYIADANNLPVTGWFAVAAGGLFWVDKLAILLLAYCIFATVIDIGLQKHIW